MNNELFRQNILLAMAAVVCEMSGDTGKIFTVGLTHDLDLSVWAYYDEMVNILANFDKVPAGAFTAK